MLLFLLTIYAIMIQVIIGWIWLETIRREENDRRRAVVAAYRRLVNRWGRLNQSLVRMSQTLLLQQTYGIEDEEGWFVAAFDRRLAESEAIEAALNCPVHHHE